MHLLDRLLWRLSRSGHADRVVLKGGLLVASMTGVAQRTTMDMDATVRGVPMDEGYVVAMVEDICAVPCDDGIEFSFERIEPIREDDEYANFRAHIRASLGKISAPLKIDITTGDVITPSAISYPYRPVFGGDPISIMAYPVETMLAEKFETIVRRGAANGRARDLYDLVVLLRLHGDRISWDVLHEAIYATAEKRGSAQMMPGYRDALEDVRASGYMRDSIWAPYCEDNPYASGITLDDAVDAATEIGDRSGITQSS